MVRADTNDRHRLDLVARNRRRERRPRRHCSLKFLQCATAELLIIAGTTVSCSNIRVVTLVRLFTLITSFCICNAPKELHGVQEARCVLALRRLRCI